MATVGPVNPEGLPINRAPGRRGGSFSKTVPNKPKPIKTANNQPFFVDMVTLEKLYFQNIPLTLDYDPQTTLVSLPSYGRNITDYQFTGAEDALKFDLTWYGDTVTRDDVIKNCKWLEAMSKDSGDGSGIHPIKLVFGDMYQDAQWVVKSAAYTLSLFNRVYGMLPQLATSKIVLSKIASTNPTRSSIMRVNT